MNSLDNDAASKDGVENIYDSEGNVIDVVMPGNEGILNRINLQQYEQNRNNWTV
jgi:hypothetical protein